MIFEGQSALFYASGYNGLGNLGSIYALLVFGGANPDFVDTINGRTCLMYAASYTPDLRFVYSLLEYGADPRIVSNSKRAADYGWGNNLFPAINLWNIIAAANTTNSATTISTAASYGYTVNYQLPNSNAVIQHCS